ncbi:MAG: amidohydrolase [Deltaproteobacteria bacterium]|jgi:predicted TIM-barrel fold metal-dependent hydrolase|nr:amidohydrolase [Deltaproteobacteria bacterium]
MQIDVHIHLSSPEIKGDRPSLLIREPALKLLYSSVEAKMASTEDVLATLKENGIDKALVGGFPFQDEDCARRYNDWLISECQKHPDILYPLVTFDPRASFAIEMARYYLDNGAYGLGELCVYDEGLTPRVLENLSAMCLMCLHKNAPILVHVNEPIGHDYPGKAPIELKEIYSLVKASHGAKLILAHFGGGLPFYASLKKELKETLKTVRFDTAAMPFLFDPISLKLAAQLLGPQYFLFGSDYPLLDAKRYRKYLAASGLTASDCDLIMGENARAFLGL